MLIAGLIGQVDLAADNLNIVIYGLLVVAALLAVLTIWYWRHTKPRPVVIESATGAASANTPPVEEPVSDDAIFERAMGDDFDPDSVWADSPETPPTPAAEPVVPLGSKTVDPLDDDEEMSADEWLAITGPDQVADESRQ